MGLLSILTTFWEILKNWWWLPLPFLLYRHFIFFWMFRQMEKYDITVKKIVLEIKIPKEVIKPIKAMEQVISGFHGIHDVFVWRERWLQGEFQLSLSLEIVGIDGEVHFYIRAPEAFRDIIESNIYSQYPETEISVVEDYAKAVPQNIPNKDWDLFGFDFTVTQPEKDPYPIRTYKDIEEPKEIKEEKRLDPLAGLLDGMAILGPGEQMWLQIIVQPVRDEIPWRARGLEIVDELVHREKGKTTTSSILKESADVLISGKVPGDLLEEEKERERNIIPPEMRLTPGEREVVEAIEKKIAKFGFDSNIRCLYLAKRDAFFKPKARMFYGFFKNVSTENLNGLKPLKTTLPKVQLVFKKKRTYLRKRALFRRYVRRFKTYFPNLKRGGTYILNTEEVATLYHFPGRMVAPAPGVPRVEAKRGEAPPRLPVE